MGQLYHVIIHDYETHGIISDAKNFKSLKKTLLQHHSVNTNSMWNTLGLNLPDLQLATNSMSCNSRDCVNATVKMNTWKNAEQKQSSPMC